jgi:hypothetical protein
VKRRDIQEIKLTKTHKFILPMCDINPKVLPVNYINTFITNESNIIVLIFDITVDNLGFNMFLDINKFNNCFVKVEEYLNESLVYFKIPDKHIEDYNKFIEGKYSLFSENYKEILLKLYTREVAARDSYLVNMVDVLYPHEGKRKILAKEYNVNFNIFPIEVLAKPNIEHEIYVSLYDLIQKHQTNNLINNLNTNN